MTEPLSAAEQARAQEADAAAGRRSIRRIWLFSILAWGAFAGWFAAAGDFDSLLGLTCSSLVVMINFLWLEEIAMRLLVPAPQVRPWTFGFRALARYSLLGTAVAVFAVRFNFLSVLLGMSVLVLGMIAEALYALITSRDAN